MIDVGSGSQGSRVGLREGDVIQGVNGIPVGSESRLRREVEEISDEGCTLTVWNFQGTRQVRLWEAKTDSEQTAPIELVNNAATTELSGKDLFSGVVLTELQESWRSHYEIPTYVKGLLLMSVEPGCALNRLGVREGNVIEAVNRWAVRSPYEARAALDRTGRSVRELRVWNHSGSRKLLFGPQDPTAGVTPSLQRTGAAQPLVPPVTEESRTPRAGSLTVTAGDEGCEVFVDGAFVGNSPAKLKLTEGAHIIQVKRAGFKDYKKEIKVADGSELNLRAVLEKNRIRFACPGLFSFGLSALSVCSTLTSAATG